MQKHLLEKYIKPTIIDLASKLTTEWSDDTAMQLHETLGDYLELSTCEHLSRKDEPVPYIAIGNGEPNPFKDEEFVTTETVGAELVERKKLRNTPDHYVPRHVVNARQEKLYSLLTDPETLGKDIVITPETFGMGCTLRDIAYVCKKFNCSAWRKKNAPNSKVMYRQQLMNVTARLVRADQDLRALRYTMK